MGKTKKLPGDHQAPTGKKSILIVMAEDGGLRVTFEPASAWRDVREIMMALGMADAVVLRALDRQGSGGTVGG